MALRDAAPKLQILIPRLASDSDGEVIATVSAIRRTLKKNGVDLHDLASAVSGETHTTRGARREKKENPKTDRNKYNYNYQSNSEDWSEILDYLNNCIYDLSPREREFIEDMGENLEKWGTPTERQGAWMKSIYEKMRRMHGL